LELNDRVTFGLIALNLLHEQLAENFELLIIEHHSELSHGIAGSLSKAEGCSTCELVVDSIHEGVFVDEAGLPQDNQAEPFKDLGADIEALFPYLSRSIFNSAVQMRINGRN